MNWFSLALQVRGSVTPRVLPQVFFFSGLGLFASWLHSQGYGLDFDFTNSLLTNVVFNFILGLLLVFRTNSGYDRYWEGRKIWGSLVISLRNLGRLIKVAIAAPDPTTQTQKKAALHRLIALTIATKRRLRQEPVNEELESLLSATELEQLKGTKNPPLTISIWLGEYLQTQYLENRLDSNQLGMMNQCLNEAIEAYTGCERILTTPIPPAYNIYLRKLLLIYCLALPWQLVRDLHWSTGLVVGLISFVLLCIEEIGQELEDPFGYEPNDLPIDEICQNFQDYIETLLEENPHPES